MCFIPHPHPFSLSDSLFPRWSLIHGDTTHFCLKSSSSQNTPQLYFLSSLLSCFHHIDYFIPSAPHLHSSFHRSFHLDPPSLRTTLDLSSSFHDIVSLPYIRTCTSNVSCNILAHSSCKSLPLATKIRNPKYLNSLTPQLH